MNKKGFTMIELLATMVILGVLSTIGVVSVTRYIGQSKVKSYKMMSQSVYESAMNCIVQNKCDAPSETVPSTYTTEELINLGSIKKLEDPGSKNKTCSGTVVVNQQVHTDSEYKNYYYVVSLKCPSGLEATLVWPYSKSVEVDDIINNKSSNLNDFKTLNP